VLKLLDRMADRSDRKRRTAEQDTKLTAIDAEELAARLKGKVIGQDDVIDQVAQILRRRGCRVDKAMGCGAGASGSNSRSPPTRGVAYLVVLGPARGPRVTSARAGCR